MILVIGIAAVLAAAVVMIIATARHEPTAGSVSRETRHSDSGTPIRKRRGADVARDRAARQRARETRATLSTGAITSLQRRGRAPAPVTPLGPAELGLSRRQFFNRGILLTLSVATGAFGASLLAFLWPSTAGGFGGKVTVDMTAGDIVGSLATKKEPLYIPEARSYLQPYPKADLERAANVYQPAIVEGMAQGLVALYQKCPHLGCKVPWCPSSQWFECPCHGSKYNRVGEKRGGPAPRGMDRFAMRLSRTSITIDTSIVYEGPPVGTDTTGQGAEGPPCVG